MALKKVEEIVFSNPVVFFSKTYSGYSKRVKQLFTKLGAVYKVIELDDECDGREIQPALAEWTGQGTVPNVFVAGKHIGGSDSMPNSYSAILLLSDQTDFQHEKKFLG